MFTEPQLYKELVDEQAVEYFECTRLPSSVGMRTDSPSGERFDVECADLELSEEKDNESSLNSSKAMFLRRDIICVRCNSAFRNMMYKAT